MSATGRGKKDRDPFDYYPTPTWCVDRFLEKAQSRLKKGVWVEPCAGDGAIIRACRRIPGIVWHAVELQDRFEDQLAATPRVVQVSVSDFLDWHYPPTLKSPLNKADVIITNPPYKQAFSMIQHALTQADQVCMLLRLNFLASEVRCEWMQNNTPDVYVIPNRPSFRGKGSDACEYGWFVWDWQSSGRIFVLNTTEKKVRSAEKRKALQMLAT